MHWQVPKSQYSVSNCNHRVGASTGGMLSKVGIISHFAVLSVMSHESKSYSPPLTPLPGIIFS